MIYLLYPQGLEYADGIPSTDVRLSSLIRVWQETTSDGEALVLEIWETWSTPSLSLFPCLF